MSSHTGTSPRDANADNSAGDPAGSLVEAMSHRLAAFDLRTVNTPRGVVAYREAGAGIPVVLLHGIGGASASWLYQLEAFGVPASVRRDPRACRVLAWDAPGYGGSAPLEMASPGAADYAQALASWLSALSIERAVIVGHSLGALMAGAFAARYPECVLALMTISPAGGYGSAPADLRAEKLASRLTMLATLGPRGMAEQRSANLCAPDAAPSARAWVSWNMARIVPDGYRQATHMLSNGDLAQDLVRFGRTHLTHMAVGAQDAVTTPASCERLAQAAGLELEILPGLGHACHIEAPDRVNAWIRQCMPHA
jgi:pimeloyl-ACP methyl ester carboxylesterase